MPPAHSIEFGGVRISDTGIAELDKRRPLVTVMRANIERVTLRHGWQSHRPLLLLLFAAGVSVAGLFPVAWILHWMLHGGTLSVWLPAGAPFPFVVAAWAVFDATRRGFYLLVEGPQGREKLCFTRRAAGSEIEAFLRQAEQRFGYQVGRGLELDRGPA
jgi:hypothetical protein